eukprot:CAMPEP_0174257874 /NCGR_PEP_ID=MMETSP0439-20130205/6980_1 /TAXON_ID=0 /ORGANISM="Stereomyxa ramosa, Strain Chinc5" /LENGTH=474 /DNA_ID=CAMNT_0015341167 /DNA_START=477 /DNA_END=1898 /DNA_ORIENTATION=+
MENPKMGFVNAKTQRTTPPPPRQSPLPYTTGELDFKKEPNPIYYHPRTPSPKQPETCGLSPSLTQSDVERYLEAYSRFIARHISADPEVFAPGVATSIVQNPSTCTPLAFQTYAVLACGARVKGRLDHAKHFVKKAREALGKLFDQTYSLVAQGLMILSYYMSGEAEADKTMYYLQLAKNMCHHLDTRSTDYYMLILMTIGFASPHPDEKIEVFTELKQRIGPLVSDVLGRGVLKGFALTLSIISVQLELELSKLAPKYNADYTVMLQVLERLERMLYKDESTSYSKLGFGIFLEVIKAQCYCNLGCRNLAVKCTSQVSEICKDPEFQYVPIGVLGGIAMMATIQLQENRLDLVREHISRMQKMGDIYPFVKLIAKKLQEALQEKVAKHYEQINQIRQMETQEKKGTASPTSASVPATATATGKPELAGKETDVLGTGKSKMFEATSLPEKQIPFPSRPTVETKKQTQESYERW